MNDRNDMVSRQAEALLKALGEQQQANCRQVLGESETRAQDLLSESRQQARARIRQAVSEERRRRAADLHQSTQRIQSAERHRIQAQYGELLQRAWPKLVAALQGRWSDDAGRDQWCEQVVDEARQVLSPGSWIIEHPKSWRTANASRLMLKLTEYGVAEPHWCADESIKAGIRIRHAGACLDGTIDGLLANRPEIEALLLASWVRQSAVAGVSPNA